MAYEGSDSPSKWGSFCIRISGPSCAVMQMLPDPVDKRAASSDFGICGHSSISLPVSSRALLLLLPNTLPPPTSLATIQSHPLRVSLAAAFSRRLPVSAAKPTTRSGRAYGTRAASRMSGFPPAR